MLMEVPSTVVDKEELKLRLMRVKYAITETQAYQSFYANRDRNSIEFNVGDLVLLSSHVI